MGRADVLTGRVRSRGSLRDRFTPEAHEENAGPVLYDDGKIACDDKGLLIRRYYPWGAKRVPYASIKGVTRLPLSGPNRARKWRIWGSGDFVHWWNLDPGRPGKDVALVIDVGGRVRPTITPEDPQTVERILSERVGQDSTR
jgi:hypothetical protein